MESHHYNNKRTGWEVNSFHTFPFILALCALITALGLTVISWMRLCSQTCAEGHSYRIFGLSFEFVGMIFFPLLCLLHVLSRKYPALVHVTGWALCAALGSEIIFIYIQKYRIGSWCPVCLSIAASLLVAAGAYFY